MNVASAPSVRSQHRLTLYLCPLLFFPSPGPGIKMGRFCCSYDSTSTPRVRSFVVLILVLKGRIAAHTDVLYVCTGAVYLPSYRP